MLASRPERAPLWGAFLLVLTGIATSYFGWGEIWLFIKKNPTAPIMVIATLIAYNGLRTQRKLARVKNAIDFQNNYLSSEISKKNIIKTVHMAHNSPSESLRADTLKDEDLLSIREVLNSFERMAIGIEINAYDPSVLFRSYATTVTTVWVAFRPYIRDRQKSTPHIYCNFDKLAIDWMMRRHEKITNEEKKRINDLQGEISTILAKYNN